MTTERDMDGFYRGLVEHGLIVPVGVMGAFGRGAEFEDVIARFDALVTRSTCSEVAERIVFPPILDRDVLERSEYVVSFPQLAGAIFSFAGSDEQHEELVARVHAGKPWDDLQ